MARIKKEMKKTQDFKTKSKFHPWLMNKIKFIRQKSKPLAARAKRWGGPSGIILIFLLVMGSFFYPRDEIQKLRIYLLNHPYEFDANLTLAEKLLAKNQFEEAGQVLALAQEIMPAKKSPDNRVLGKSTSSRLENLWRKKHEADPQDIKKLIVFWEKIIQEKPNYRDGYLQLAALNYKIWQNEKAKEYLKQALIIDPNFEAAKEMEKIIQP